MAVTNIVTQRGKQQFNGVFDEVWAVSFRESSNVAPTTGANVLSNVTVPGAKFGDQVLGVSTGVSQNGLAMTGYVSAANTVTIAYVNNTASTVTLTTPKVYFVLARPNFIV